MAEEDNIADYEPGYEDGGVNSPIVTHKAITEQELYDRLAYLFTQQLILTQDIGQLKKDAKFNRKRNPTGIPAADVALISDAAKLEAKNVFEEYVGKAKAVIDKFKELSGYDN